MILISFNSNIIRYARTYNLNIYYQKSSINSLDKRIHMTVRFLHLHFKFTFTFTFLHQRSPVTSVTFVIGSQSFYFFTFKRPFTFKLRRDAAVATSRRVWRCVGTQPSLRRDAVSDASGGEVKNIRMQAAIPRDALSDSSNIFLSYTGLLIFYPCVRQQYKM